MRERDNRKEEEYITETVRQAQFLDNKKGELALPVDEVYVWKISIIYLVALVRACFLQVPAL